MRWRPSLPAVIEFGVPARPAPRAPEPEPRSPGIAQALARLETATRLRDGDAAARILNGLADTEDGQWLLRQCVAAGLREVAHQIAQADGPVADSGPRAVGPAA